MSMSVTKGWAKKTIRSKFFSPYISAPEQWIFKILWSTPHNSPIIMGVETGLLRSDALDQTLNMKFINRYENQFEENIMCVMCSLFPGTRNIHNFSYE